MKHDSTPVERPVVADASIPRSARRMTGLTGRQLAGLSAADAVMPLGAAWGSGVGSADSATERGLVVGAMLLLQMLSSGCFERLSGRVGIDRLKSFHRLAGIAVLLFALLHPLGYVLSVGTLVTCRRRPRPAE